MVDVVVLGATEVDLGVKVVGRGLRVPPTEMHGGWARRPWKEDDSDEEKTLGWGDLLGRVQLKPDETLHADSLRWLEKWTSAVKAHRPEVGLAHCAARCRRRAASFAPPTDVLTTPFAGRNRR